MINIIDTPSSVYSMHKYWGKKPGKELKQLIEKYTKEGDYVLDPFSGYGGMGIESILLNRNVILNDLNPIATFISSTVINYDVDLNSFLDAYKKIKQEYDSFSRRWYTYGNEQILTILRNKEDVPLRLRIKNAVTGKIYEKELTKKESLKLEAEEKEYNITQWYPKNTLIKNSRIGVKDNMRIQNLFPKRALICHSYLFDIISRMDDSIEKDLFKMAFTANLANCSKLVPPISSRGEMAQGAWMTGYYIGEKYLENNVFHYFENRVNKIVKGKRDLQENLDYKPAIGKYVILNDDAKALSIENETIDFVFTDFPYGGTVPYFEQSQLWNAWLNYNVDYENEIVISDSLDRKKSICEFENDINMSISEIHRVLKNQSYFVFTFHSLYGNEWRVLSNALSRNGFEFVESKLLSQKTYTPRQLNRKKSIKGDLLVVYKKTANKPRKHYDNIEIIIEDELIKKCHREKFYDTNELIVLCVNKLLSLNTEVNSVDFIDIMNKCFDYVDEKWRMKHELCRF